MNLKKTIRYNFRTACFNRDGNRCIMCGAAANDAHHIHNRHEFAHGGYVPENGASLCLHCHEKAEEFHRTGISLPGFSPEELYAKIGSSYEKAVEADAQAT